MKNKRLSNIAFANWLVAAVFAVADVWAFWTATLYNPYDGYIPLHTNVVEVLRQMVESVLSISGALVAFGAIIEKLDQIRWNTTPKDQ